MSQLDLVFSKDLINNWIYCTQANGWVNSIGARMVVEALAEQSDPNFTSRHGTRHCRNQGCTGPMCAKAARDHMRRTRPPGVRPNARHKYARFDELLERLQGSYNYDWERAHEDEEISA